MKRYRLASDVATRGMATKRWRTPSFTATDRHGLIVGRLFFYNKSYAQ
jgi:hypothetical protein